jgi:hypothetical protein
MRLWKLLLPLLASTLCFATQADRIAGTIDSSQMVALKGGVHGLAQPRFDLGRTDGGKLLHGVTLAFRPSAPQQEDLNNLLAEQQDRSSSNYHKWLTPAQFADRFGMTQDDINRVQAWLESQGFTVTSVANSRNQISFDGTVAQIEAVFRTEIHNYLVDSEIHFANATNPSVPAALAASVLMIGHLHNFNPKPRIRVQPRFTSDQTGNHFLTPGDFATIYNIPSGMDGTGQSIAIVGQSAVASTDLSNFRSAAGLAAKAPQMILYPSNSISTHCSGDEDESDLDLEWSGGVARNANVIFVYAGLLSGEVCGSQTRTYSVWDALQQAVDNNYAPVISISYGFCEQGLPPGFPATVQGWAQQANAQGQTVVASTGDSGAADCDGQVASATQGLAVDIPAAIPEVTGMGGNEFFGDPPSTTTTTYWEGASGSDTISSALIYIPEEGWNDTVADGVLSASGGGASTLFSKPTWQTGTGVPPDRKRDVPDLALSASADHDSYLICSPTDPAGNPSCTNGFRDSSTQGYLDPIGGTSCAAPSFAAIVALLNQSLGASGLGNINPQLYSLAASTPGAFHDVTAGNNIVPCTSGTPNCPTTGTPQFGFSAGVGYDQVTGLGSVDANVLFTAWPSSRTSSSITITPSATNVYTGTSVTFSVAVTPSAGVGTVSFSTSTGGPVTLLGTATLNIPYQPSNPNNGTATFTTSALPAGANSVTATYEGDASHSGSVSAPAVVTVTAPFTMTASPASFSVPAGQTATSTITVTPVGSFTGTVNFNSTTSPPGGCTAGLPRGAVCSFNQGGSVTISNSSPQTIILTITTAANMALPSGAQAITVTGTTGSSAVNAIVNLTVTATNQSYTLSSTNGITFNEPQGGTASIQVAVAGTGSPIPFVSTSMSNPTTALPLTYTCTGSPALPAAEISCVLPNNGQPTNAAVVTVTLKTTPVTTQLRPPLGGGNRIFYALLLPGLFGVVFAAGSRTRGLRLLSLIVVLGFSTLWLGSCGGGGNGNNIQPNPGTPPGTYTVTIAATTGGAVPLTNSNTFTITLNVQ